MKKITIAGIGLTPATITPQAAKAAKTADALIGSPRLLSYFSDLNKPSYETRRPGEIISRITAANADNITVLVSGDVGFYSAAAALSELSAKDCEVDFIPGVSAVNAFFAKLKMPWQEAKLISTHGRETDIVGAVRRNRLTFCLTGNNVPELGKSLCDAGYGGVKAYVGENLHSQNERVYQITARDLSEGNYPPLTVLLFENNGFDDSVKTGLSDDKFARAKGIPMTKSETRAVVMSKLRVFPSAVCWDIGAGTGSVTVETALSAYNGWVYAVERNQQAVSLIRENCAAFHIGNVTAVHGSAPAALHSLPSPDIVFIGGSGGNIELIIAAVYEKNPLARVVVTAITPQTISTATAAFDSADMETKMIQLNISRSETVNKTRLTTALNPVTIITAEPKGDRL